MEILNGLAILSVSTCSQDGGREEKKGEHTDAEYSSVCWYTHAERTRRSPNESDLGFELTLFESWCGGSEGREEGCEGGEGEELHFDV